MGLIDAVKRTFTNKSEMVDESHNQSATIANLRLLAKDTISLKGLVDKLDNNQIAEEQFIAVCVAALSRELLQYREMEEKQDLQNW